MARFDTIIIGLGGMGAATAWHLARRGQRVLGLEQYGFVHDRGSSHGATRIIRMAYFEHPDYVPLLKLAYAGWEELAEETDEELINLCGMFLAGRPEDSVIAGTRRSAARHGLPLEDIDPDQMARRFPAYRPTPDMDLIFDPLGGYLRVERCVQAHLDGARTAGATLHEFEPVTTWEATEHGVRVTTGQATYEAETLIITAGAWAGGLLRELGLPLTPRRAVMAWFEPTGIAHHLENNCPVFGIQTPEGFFYGFPWMDGRGVKVAAHGADAPLPDPALLERTVRPEEIEDVRRFAARYLTGLNLDIWDAAACIYTMTPDEHFIVDRHPAHANVFIAAGFSGHGFKFTPAIGKIMADYAMTGETPEPAQFLTLERFNRV